MKTIIRLFLLSGCLSLSAFAQSSTSPVGFISYSFAASATGTTYYISAPLLTAVTFSGTPTAIGTNTITVSTAGWTDSQFVTGPAGQPYYALPKSGNEAGRALRITANTTTQLTVDVTDDSTQTTDLTTSGFALGTTNGFEISAGYTLKSLFGDSPSAFPGSGTSLSLAGGIGLWNSKTLNFEYYYWDTYEEQWVKIGSDSSKDAGDTIIPPGATIAIQIPAGYAGGKFISTGRVPTIAPLIKNPGNNVIRYYGMRIPVDMTFSQLNLGSNWTKSDSILTADTLSIHNSALAKWESYYQLTNSEWRKAGDSSTNQNSTTIPAGSAVAFLKRDAVSGASSFLTVPLPYTP